MYITQWLRYATQLVARKGVTTIVALGNIKYNLRYWPSSSKKFGLLKV